MLEYISLKKETAAALYIYVVFLAVMRRFKFLAGVGPFGEMRFYWVNMEYNSLLVMSVKPHLKVK